MNKQKTDGELDGARTRYVWVDARKTRDEMRPARLTHRAHEILETIVSGKHPGTAVEKDMMGKRCKISATIVCYSLRGESKLSPTIDRWLNEDEKQQVVAYAESN